MTQDDSSKLRGISDDLVGYAVLEGCYNAILQPLNDTKKHVTIYDSVHYTELEHVYDINVDEMSGWAIRAGPYSKEPISEYMRVMKE